MWAWWAKQFHEPKYGSGQGCQVIAWTRQQGLVLYIGYKWVNVAARPPGGSLAELGSLTTSNLPFFLFGEAQSGLKSRTGSDMLRGRAQWCRWNGAQRHGKWPKIIGNQRKNRDHLDSEKSWRPKNTCCLSDSGERPSAISGVKNSRRVKIKIKKKF